MNISVVSKENGNIAVINSDEIVINNVQDALDLIVKIHYEYGCDKMIISKRNMTEGFFDLKNRLAGEIMQKFVNYGIALAIIGSFEEYGSNSLKSLMYESNTGNRIIFKKTEAEAIDAWTN